MTAQLGNLVVAPVSHEEWPVVAWLWQDFRHDLAAVSGGFPLADGRYRHEWLDQYPGPGRVGYLARVPHPVTFEPSPIAFALVKGLDTPRAALQSFFVVPAARRYGVGRRLAVDIVRRHPGEWEIAFQGDNAPAAAFWRSVADEVFGTWSEDVRPVPDRPHVPPDHWITGRTG